MAVLAILGQKQVEGLGRRQYVITQVRHDGGSNTVSVDQSADIVRAVPTDGQTTPTVTLGDADSDFLKQVTVSGGGSGLVDVITYHKTAVGSSKS